MAFDHFFDHLFKVGAHNLPRKQNFGHADELTIAPIASSFDQRQTGERSEGLPQP